MYTYKVLHLVKRKILKYNKRSGLKQFIEKNFDH